MPQIVCAQSAFRFHRVPPQLRALYPPLPGRYQDSNHRKLASCSTASDLLGTPIHRLVRARSAVNSGATYQSHLVGSELPFGCIQETDHGFLLAGPELTLLTMAPSIDRIELLMATYELCGSFSVFQPTVQTESLLKEAADQGFIPENAGWKRVVDTKDAQTSLWKRDPVTSPESLRSFLDQTKGLRGSKNLAWAIDRVTGTCASPFEVQASILLGLSRRLGGEGLPIQNNHRIRLNKQARALYGHDHCFADIYIEASESHPALDIECQGRSIHDSEAAGISDADRAAALERMGIQVIQLSYKQFSNERSYQAVKELIALKLGVPVKPKTPGEQAAEKALRHKLFIDWNTLGTRTR